MCIIVSCVIYMISLVISRASSGIIFFSYLTDFSYFSLIKIFRKLQDMVRTVQKRTY